MADETTGYAGAAGIAFAHTVVDQLGDKEIAPTPPNYELWATYRTGAFPDLNREVEARIAAGEELTPALCEDLYERFFMPTRSYEQLVQTGESIAHELVGALVHLREANTNAGAFASKLEDAASDMEATPDPSHIKTLVRNLVAETREVAARNRTLETQMEASSKQMESLQVSVRQATLEAVTDGLTGLANRRHFDRLLSRQVMDAEERAAPLCLIMCDIDHFKRSGVGDAPDLRPRAQSGRRWRHDAPVGVRSYVGMTQGLRIVGALRECCGKRGGGRQKCLSSPA